MTSDKERWTWPTRPRSDAEFNEMMSSLDRHLAAQGRQPFQRSLQALAFVSQALGLSGQPLFPRPHERGAPFSAADLMARVSDWYDSNYGERNKFDPSPGSVVLRMHESLWRLRIPRVYGTVTVFVDPELSDEAPGATHNLLLSVEHLTQAYASRLTIEDCQSIVAGFQAGYAAVSWLDSLKGHELFDHARDDYQHSVDALMAGHWHKARWDTAQTAEKVFKGLLARAGASYPTAGRDGHDIVAIGSLVSQSLAVALPAEALAAIHCPPAVRYGEAPADSQDALAAHQALVRCLAVLSGRASRMT